MTRITHLTAALLLISTGLFAQSADTRLKKNDVENGRQTTLSKMMGSLPIFDEDVNAASSWGGIPYTSQTDVPFSTRRIMAGDINGDGRTDYAYSQRQANISTSDLTDDFLVTKIWFGPNTSTTPSITIEDQGFFWPVGDINNDGFDDALYNRPSDNAIIVVAGGTNGYDSGNIITTNMPGPEWFIPFPSSTQSTNDYIRSWIDINGDGIDDIMFYDETISDQLGILFGGSLNVATYNVSPNMVYEAANLDNDSRYEIVGFEYWNANGTNNAITVWEYSNLTTLSVQASFTSSFYTALGGEGFSQVQRMYLNDIDGDGNADLSVYGLNHVLVAWYLGTGNGDFFTDAGNSAQQDLSEVSFRTVFPVGDMNDDGRTDYFFDNEGIWFGPASFVDHNISNVSIGIPFAGANIYTGNGTFPMVHNSTGYHGDINGDGLWDFLTEYRDDENEEIGNVFVTDNAFGSVTFNRNTYPAIYNDNVRYTLNLGDVNGDGIEDFGVVRDNSILAFNDAGLEVFFGGQADFSTPDLEIFHPEGWRMNAPAVGDFNNDGISDIAINYREFGAENGGQGGVYVYFGGVNPDNTADREYIISAIEPGVDGIDYNAAFTLVANAGDLNNDDIDDLAFNAYGSDNLHIVLGGTSMSTSPNFTRTITGGVSNLIPLGDIDADGVKELAIYSFRGSANEVFIWSVSFGVNLIQDFSITAPTPNGERYFAFGLGMDAGDFTGDGILDLAITAFQHQNSDFSEGVDAIFIYEGGSNFDGTAESSFPIELDLIRGAGNTNTNQFSRDLLGELTAIPDVDGDGTQELLVGSSPGRFNPPETNMIIYYGNADAASIGNAEPTRLLANNQLYGLGSNVNNIYNQYAGSAAGYFDNSGRLNIIAGQGNDFNYEINPFFMYQVGSAISDLPITFEDDGVDYSFTDFGGAGTNIVSNPDQSGVNTSNTVLEFTKYSNAQSWAGAYYNVATIIDFPANGNELELKVWSPLPAGTPIVLKVENTNSGQATGGGFNIEAEVQVNTTVQNQWETLTFDLSQDPDFDPNGNHNNIVLFYDFGTAGSGTDITAYFDDFTYAGGVAVDLATATEQTDYTWFQIGDADWFGQTSESFDGQDAAQSGDVNDSQSSGMYFTVDQAGDLSFYWKVSSEADFDYLYFRVLDGSANVIEEQRISGEVDWTQVTHSMNSGESAQFLFSKDGSVSNGADAGWVDQVVFTPEQAQAGELLAYYPLDASVVDASRNGYNGVYRNINETPSSVIGAQGRLGDSNGAVYFPNNGNHIVFNHSGDWDTDRNFTANVWVYNESRPQSGSEIWDQILDLGDACRLMINIDGQLDFHYQAANGSDFPTLNAGTDSEIPLQTWTMVSISIDDSETVRLYKNGQLVMEEDISDMVSISSQGVFLSTNDNFSGDARFFDGAMDNVRFFNYKLSDDDIFTIYLDEQPPAGPQFVSVSETVFYNGAVELTFDRALDATTMVNAISISGANTGSFSDYNLGLLNSGGNVVRITPIDGLFPAADEMTINISNSLQGADGLRFDGNANGTPDGSADDLDVTFNVAYLSDMNASGSTTVEDLETFRTVWNGQQLYRDIAPTTGTKPFYNVNPDGVINFEDLMMFTQSWNWTVFNAKSVAPLAKSADGETISPDWSLESSVAQLPAFNSYSKAHLTELSSEGPVSMTKTSSASVVYQEFDASTPPSSESVYQVMMDMSKLSSTMEFVIRFDPEQVRLKEIRNAEVYGEGLGSSTVFLSHIDAEDGTGLIQVSNFGELFTENARKPVAELIFEHIGEAEEIPAHVGYTIFRNSQEGQSYLAEATMTKEEMLPEEFSLLQNFPNPFNPSTTIRYHVPEAARVQVRVFDIAGRQVASLVNNELQEPGFYQRNWDAARMASGVYLYVITAQTESGMNFKDVKKMTLLK